MWGSFADAAVVCFPSAGHGAAFVLRRENHYFAHLHVAGIGTEPNGISAWAKFLKKIETTVTQPPEVIKHIKEILKESG